MKKLLPLLSFALLLSATASAQGLRYGITGAMNLSNYAIESDASSYTSDSRIGFRAGFRMEIGAPFIYDGFYFMGEAVLSSKGSKLSTSMDDKSVKNISRPYYLEIPLHIGYHYAFKNSSFGIFGSAGPYFGVGLFGENKLTVGDVNTKPDTFSSESLKRFDFGLGVRAGVSMFNHYRIYLGYDWGLINIAQTSGDKVNNRNFYVGAAYMF